MIMGDMTDNFQYTFLNSLTFCLRKLSEEGHYEKRFFAVVYVIVVVVVVVPVLVALQARSLVAQIKRETKDLLFS